MFAMCYEIRAAPASQAVIAASEKRFTMEAHVYDALIDANRGTD